MFHVEWSIVGQLVRKGIPMGAQVLVISLSSVLMIALVNRFGVETTAAYGALRQLWTYVMMPALAMAVAVSTITAQNIGARSWYRVKQSARIGIGYSFVVTGGAVAMVYLAGSSAYSLFLPDRSLALPIAGHINQIVTWSLIFMTIPVVLFGVMRATGAVIAPLLIHTLSLLFVRYLLAAVLLERWHSDAIWWSFTISAGIDVVLAVLYYRYGRWRRVQAYTSAIPTGRAGQDGEPDPSRGWTSDA
jgi:Na+-driven multidrug efflux pump